MKLIFKSEKIVVCNNSYDQITTGCLFDVSYALIIAFVLVLIPTVLGWVLPTPKIPKKLLLIINQNRIVDSKTENLGVNDNAKE